MLDFIKSNWDSILLVAFVIIACLVAIKKGYIKQVKQGLLALVIQAEKMYGGKTGQLKFAAVATWIYEKLPAIARIFLTSQDIENLIEDAVIEMKEYLAGGKHTAEGKGE